MKNETFTPERIKAEADAFFEWDGEDRSLVTTTSCLLFAQHIAGLMQARAAQPAPVVPDAAHTGLKDLAHEYRHLLLQQRFSDNDEGDAFARHRDKQVDRIDRILLTAAPAQGQQVEWRTTAVMLE